MSDRLVGVDYKTVMAVWVLACCLVKLAAVGGRGGEVMLSLGEFHYV